MIKPLKLFIILSLSTFVLSACGAVSTNGTSSQNKENSSIEQSQNTNPAKGMTSGVDSSANESVEKKEDKSKDLSETKGSSLDNGTLSTSKGKEPPKEKQIELDTKAKQHVKGTIFESEHLPLYIYSIPGYQVREGNSGKNLVVTNTNQTIKMTIAPIDRGMSIEDVKKSTMEEMQQISQHVKEITTLKNDKFYQNATVLYASNAKEIESTYLLPINGYPLKVTITRPGKTDTAIPYLQAIMKSIGVKNSLKEE